MPALPAAAGVVRLAMKGTTGTVPWLSRVFLHYSGTPPTAAQLNTFTALAITSYGTNLKSLAYGGVVLSECDATDLTSATGAVGISTGSTAGTRAGTAIDSAACAVISYEIARRYRGGHPRGYWPFGVANDLNATNAWSAAFVTACNTGFNNWIAALVAGGWAGAGTIAQVNVSYYNGFTVVTNPITHRARNVPTLRVSPTIDTVTAILTRPSVGTQRRRIAFVN